MHMGRNAYNTGILAYNTALLWAMTEGYFTAMNVQYNL